MPHISVCIPVFNRAHLIGRTIECALRQDFQDFDLLVVDDASSDNTVEIVRTYACQDPRVKLVVNSKNLGLTRNFNRCLELASGPLIQILQSDDLVDADYLSKASQIFDLHPNVGFVSAKCRHIDIDDHILSNGINESDRLIKAGDDAVKSILHGSPHVSSVIIKKDSYTKHGGFNEEFWFAPDIEMYTRLAANVDYFRFGCVKTSFRRHGTNSGMLEYLRKDYLDVFLKMNSMAFGYFSKEGLLNFGIDDLEGYLSDDASNMALNGAMCMITFGRRRFSRYYCRKAFQLKRNSWCSKQFLKIYILYALGNLGVALARRRFQVSEEDLAHIQFVEDRLRAENLLINT
jgi:glycosyltransferase involved in cell wall biosynthesis